LKEEALDCTMWRARFGRGFGPVVRQTTKWMGGTDARCDVLFTWWNICWNIKLVLSHHPLWTPLHTRWLFSSKSVVRVLYWWTFKHTGCPTRFRNRHFYNNSNTNEDIATKFEQEYVPFFHISYTMR
jgi:hypothetical protein